MSGVRSNTSLRPDRAPSAQLIARLLLPTARILAIRAIRAPVSMNSSIALIERSPLGREPGGIGGHPCPGNRCLDRASLTLAANGKRHEVNCNLPAGAADMK